MPAERTLVAWRPDWPVTAAGAEDGAPVAVVAANRVVACSAAARAEGVTGGLRRREAQARCPALLVVGHDPGRDARAFEPLVAAVEALAPAVEVIRPGLCTAPTRGPSRYFGGDEALAVKVGEAMGPGSRVGVADGLFAAALAARRSLIVPPGASAAFLAPYPVAALDRPELAGLLVRLGIRTLGAFAELPEVDVLARFGPDGLLAHRLARGLDERPRAARVPPPDLVVQAELDPPAERVDQAAFVGKALADELHARLARLGLGCTRVLVEAETEHGERLARRWRHDGSLGAAAMADRVRWQLDGWLARSSAPGAGGPTGGLSRLRVTADETAPDAGRQLGLWGGAAELDERAARGLARVQGMLGPEAVCTPVLSGGRAPVEQAALVPWGEPRRPARSGQPGDQATRVSGAPGRRSELPPWPGRIPPPSPGTVHPVPLPAELVDEAGAPVRLSVAGGRWSPVTAWAGPWPVEERWWDRAAHRRAARFQVACADGAAHLVSRRAGRWQVDATYD